MTLEQLVPKLGVCQQLKSAGFPQDTVFVWVNAPQGFISGGGLYMDEKGIHQIPETSSKGYANEVMLRSAVNTLHTVLCGAPTAEEIETELPRTILRGQIYVLEVQRRGDILDVWETDWYFNGLQLAASTTMTICGKESDSAALAYLWWKK